MVRRRCNERASQITTYGKDRHWQSSSCAPDSRQHQGQGSAVLRSLSWRLGFEENTSPTSLYKQTPIPSRFPVPDPSGSDRAEDYMSKLEKLFEIEG
jgi:hypothetical protein